MKCPNCGAEIKEIKDAETFFCNYCGAGISRDKDTNTYTYRKIYQRIDEAAILAEKRKMMEMENKKEEDKRNDKFLKWFFIGFAIVLAVAVTIVLVTESKRVTAPAEDDDVFEGMNYLVVKEQFEKAGFENIELIPLQDKKEGDSKIGQVTEVTINGDDDFSKWKLGGTELIKYDPDDLVIVKYHSQK